MSKHMKRNWSFNSTELSFFRANVHALFV